jgi:hypothetical protein
VIGADETPCACQQARRRGGRELSTSERVQTFDEGSPVRREDDAMMHDHAAFRRLAASVERSERT